MNFAYVEDGVIARYPADPYRDFPNISFPSPMSERALPLGYVFVALTDFPVAGPGQVVQEEPPLLVNGGWIQVWSVIDGDMSNTISF